MASREWPQVIPNPYNYPRWMMDVRKATINHQFFIGWASISTAEGTKYVVRMPSGKLVEIIALTLSIGW